MIGRFSLGLLVLSSSLLFGQVSESKLSPARAQFPGAPPPAYLAASPLDIDGSDQTDALTDGLLILRYLFGFQADSLVQGALTPGCSRSNPYDVLAYLQSLTCLDVDGNGKLDALTDGLLILRYLFGFVGDSLVQGAMAP